MGNKDKSRITIKIVMEMTIIEGDIMGIINNGDDNYRGQDGEYSKGYNNDHQHDIKRTRSISKQKHLHRNFKSQAN